MAALSFHVKSGVRSTCSLLSVDTFGFHLSLIAGLVGGAFGVGIAFNQLNNTHGRIIAVAKTSLQDPAPETKLREP